MRISIAIKGDDKIMARLQRLGPSLTVLPGAMNSIGATLAQYYAATGIRDQGRPYNEAWAPLAQSTLTEKQKHYPGAPAMVRTGKLSNSFYYRAGPNQVIIDNAASYYKYHQSTLPRHKLPRRAIAGLNQGLRRTIAQIVEKDVRRKIDAA